APVKLYEKRARPVELVRRRDGFGCLVATARVTNAGNVGRPTHIIEAALDWMRGNRDDAAAVGHKVAHENRLVVRVKDEVPNPASLVVTVKVGILVHRGEIVALVPRSANGTGPTELISGNGRTRCADIC